MAVLSIVVFLLSIDILWGLPANSYQGVRARTNMIRFTICIGIAPLIKGSPGDVILGEYIVVLKSKLTIKEGT